MIGHRILVAVRISGAWLAPSNSSNPNWVLHIGGIAEFERELSSKPELAMVGEKQWPLASSSTDRPRSQPSGKLEALRREATGEPLSILAQAYGVSTKTIMRLTP